jgi:SAM-dependent methyltransferase
MHEDSATFYASAPVQSLFARELAALAPILSGVYGNHGLFLRAHERALDQLPPHLLGMVTRLASAQSGQWRGDLRCSPWYLPFASESFKLIVAQHCFERFDDAELCAGELSRVLAPEGVILLLGFNPFGTWRPWLNWQSLRSAPRLHLRSASAWRNLLAGEQIDTLQVRFPGLLWPREVAAGEADSPQRFRGKLARFGSSWLLLARKRRSTLTPLRLRQATRDVALSPRLVPGAHRLRQ